jgi:hypothetical protein
MIKNVTPAVTTKTMTILAFEVLLFWPDIMKKLLLHFVPICRNQHFFTGKSWSHFIHPATFTPIVPQKSASYQHLLCLVTKGTKVRCFNMSSGIGCRCPSTLSGVTTNADYIRRTSEIYRTTHSQVDDILVSNLSDTRSLCSWKY